MKKNVYLSVAVLLFTAGCSDSFNDSLNVNQKPNEKEDHNVSVSAIRTLSGMSAETRGDDDEARKLVCIKDAANDTLLYMCDNEGGGWTIYSSDTRVPPIVAQCSKGSVNEALSNGAREAWIYSIADDMKMIREADDSDLKLTEEEIEDNKLFWRSITNSDEYMKSILRNQNTRGITDPIIPIYNWENYGHWEVIDSYYSEEVIDNVPQLIVTSWHQEYPYNAYCPNVYNNNYKGVAGCVAIAGAQMLLYLHYHLGIPTTAPSQAYCNGVFPSHQWSQYNYTDDIWIKMCMDGIYAAPLIADVGRRVDMKYGYILNKYGQIVDFASGAHTVDLVEKVFLPYGLNCTYSDYDDDLLVESLLRRFPVILDASGVYTNGELSAGHAFICDRYKKSRKKHIVIYRWIFDSIPQTPDGDLIPVPAEIPDKEEVVYVSDYMPMIGMNWGWGDKDEENEEWYSLTGSWIEKVNKINWKNNRHIIHSFTRVQ